ncbi:hypothetical protein [Actinoplanes siamensis]|nr:hypothetical protein [Actinoplanes siamensis]
MVMYYLPDTSNGCASTFVKDNAAFRTVPARVISLVALLWLRAVRRRADLGQRALWRIPIVH